MILDAAGAGSGRTGGFAFECSVGGRLLVVGPGAGGDDGHPLASWARSPQARNVLVDRRAFTPAPGRGAQRAGRVLDDARRPALLRGDGSARGRPAPPPPRVLPARAASGSSATRSSGTGRGRASRCFTCTPTPGCAPRARRPSGLHRGALRPRRASSSCSPPDGEVRVQTGLDGPRPQGWYAPRPGEFVAAPDAVARGGGYAAAGGGVRAPAPHHEAGDPALEQRCLPATRRAAPGQRGVRRHRRRSATSSWCGGGLHSRAPLATSSVMRASS